VAQQLHRGLSHFLRRPHQHSGLSILHDFRNPAGPECDHRHARGERFENHPRRSLMRGRRNEQQVKPRQSLIHIAHPACELHREAGGGGAHVGFISRGPGLAKQRRAEQCEAC